MVCYQTLIGIRLPVREFFLNSRSQRTACWAQLLRWRSELIVLEFCAGNSARGRPKLAHRCARGQRYGSLNCGSSGKLSKIFVTQYRAHGLKLHDAHELRDLISRMDTKARRDVRFGSDSDLS